jgi:VanZ family protein
MFGADHTSGPLRWLYQGIFGPISDGRWEILHGHIRKTGHFVGYGIIALAWLRAWRLSLPRFHFMQDAMLALIGTALVSCADEFHQTFLPNRTGNPRDVVLDCCGAITLQFAAYIFLRLFKPKQLTSAV